MREGFGHRLRASVPTPFNVRAIAYRADIDTARDAVMLYAVDADVPECLARLERWDIPTLSIKGGELIAIGMPAGPLVAKTLQAIEATWIQEDFPDAARQRELAIEMVNAALAGLIQSN
jgi:poly(A) polymerase